MQVNGFDNTQAYVSHYTAGTWNTSALTAATIISGGTYSLSLSGITSFSPFAIFDHNAVTAVQEIKTATSFSMSPNPAGGFINISMPASGSYPLLKIFDVIGNELVSQRIVNSNTSLNINSFPSGIYFASLDNGITQKFIKE